jgi:hypothetical protein
MARMLKTNGWDKRSPTEKSDSKPIEPLAPSTTEELSTSVGPAEGSTEHRTLEKEIIFSYRQENFRTRAWLDVWTLATHLPSLHATQLLPIDFIILPSSACSSTHLRRTIDSGILYPTKNSDSKPTEPLAGGIGTRNRARASALWPAL